MVQSDRRRLTQRESGAKMGRITRFMAPGGLGEILKPFVFLDCFDSDTNSPGLPTSYPRHAHSGIVTVTFLIKGGGVCEDSTGRRGPVGPGSLECLFSGKGAWHKSTPTPDHPIRGFQLWLALPPELESLPAESQHLHEADIPREGPVRVLLGSYGEVASPITALSRVNYFAVELADGERWSYRSPFGKSVAWLVVAEGSLIVDDGITIGGELAVFEESDGAVEVTAQGQTLFLFGTAVKHPYELVVANNSVHTSAEALHAAEIEIRKIGERLDAI